MTITINGESVQEKVFAGGECQVKIPEQDLHTVEIVADLHNANDILCLMLAVNAIRKINPHAEINLVCPYLPYARQDRICNKGESLGVKVMADVINYLNCHSIKIYDPHSDVAPALINNCKIINLAEIIESTQFSEKIIKEGWLIISPDIGAERKIRTLERMLISKSYKPEIVYATKTRDSSNSKIIANRIYGEVQNRDVIIIDDICDSGATFIELANSLKHLGAKKLFLYVTHGIFANGLDVFHNYFEHIFCYHTMLPQEKIDSNFLTVLRECKGLLCEYF